MPIVNFIFRPETTDEERAAALENVRRLKGVKSADFLMPGAKNAALQRMACAQVHKAEEAHELAREIGALSHVETASIPAARRLQASGR